MSASIEIQNLQKSFKELTVLDGISFSVEKGAVLALLGPNGAGKTTTVRILSTLLKPDGGLVKVGGYDVTKEADKVRGIIGLTGQYAAVDEYLTGRENLEMMGRLYRLSVKDTKRRTNDLLEIFELKEAANRSIRTYSGGMRRRVDLAMSLIASPPVLFLDEPTTGLDPRSRLAVWEIVRELAATDVTVLLTTQYMEEADRLADKIVVIDHGQVIAEGTANQLKSQVGSERLEFTIASKQAFAQAQNAIGDGGRLHVDEKRRVIRVASKGGVGDLKTILGRLEAARVEVEGVSLHRPTLDDVFLALTGHTATSDSKKMKNDSKALVSAIQPEQRSGLYWVISDAWVMTKRSVVHIVRSLDQLMSAVMFPIMFLILNRYVFGGAIDTGDVSYVNFLVAGILVQMLAFGANYTTINVAVDLQKGIVDRFKSLPMASSSLLTGHVVADLFRNLASAVIVFGMSFLIGFRPTANLTDWVLVIGLSILFTVAISWLSAILGLFVKTLEAAQWVGFVVIFPLTFVSSAFVPTDTMPAWLRVFADNQPLTHVINSLRAWLVGTPTGNSPVIATIWLVLIIVISVPVATWIFKRKGLRPTQ